MLAKQAGAKKAVALKSEIGFMMMPLKDYCTKIKGNRKKLKDGKMVDWKTTKYWPRDHPKTQTPNAKLCTMTYIKNW